MWRVARETEPKRRGEHVQHQREQKEVTEQAPHLGSPVGKAADEEGERCLDQSDGDIEDELVQGSIIVERVIVLVSVVPLFARWNLSARLFPVFYAHTVQEFSWALG